MPNIEVDGTIFILDEKGEAFIKECWFNHELVIENGYLASKYNNKVSFFHRSVLVYYNNEYLKNLIFGFGHVHHKNFNKKDNRLCNLQMLTKEEHMKIHNVYLT